MKRVIFPVIGILLGILNMGIFTHVFASSEFLTYAQTLSSNNIIRFQSSEYGYRLGSTISRAEAIKLALGSAHVSQNNCQKLATYSFIDVTSSLGDLCGYIEGAVTNNIISASSRFYPTTPITRADFASIIVKSFDVNYPNLIGTPSEGTLYFADVKPSVVGASFINRLATSGCINTSRQYFNPTWSITRGEAFKMMACLMNKVQGINTDEQGGQSNPTNNQAPITTSGTINEAPFMGYLWVTENYGSCSKSCGEGLQTRSVSCKKTTTNEIVADSYCQSTGVMKPVTQKLCNVQVCGGTSTPPSNTGSQSNTGNQTSPTNWPFADRDPGRGLWIPKGSKNLYVLDPHMGDFRIQNDVIVPGIRKPGAYGPDFFRDATSGKIASFHNKDVIISMRVRILGIPAGTPPERQLSYIQGIMAYGLTGGNMGKNTTVAASTIPGDFSVASECTGSGAGTPQLFIQSIRPGYGRSGKKVCYFPKDSDIYLNFKTEVVARSYATNSYSGENLPPDAEWDCVSESIDCPRIRTNYTNFGIFGGVSSSTGLTSTTQSTNPLFAEVDPGSGFWIPPTLPDGTNNRTNYDLIVGDSSAGTFAWMPGCLNGKSTKANPGCDSISSVIIGYNGNNPIKLELKPGKILAIRYDSKATLPEGVGIFRLTSITGYSVGTSVTMALSETAGNFAVSNSKCISSTLGAPLIATGKSYCPITANKHYYLNFKVAELCSTRNCYFKLTEDTTNMK